MPVSPFTFDYVLNTPEGSAGEKQLSALVTLGSGETAVQITAKPDPLIVPQLTTHSADVDRNLRISLLELTRVIELYNTRRGTVRTGAYLAASGTEDGFAPDFDRASGGTASLAAHHSADYGRDGSINLLELLRMIELYNYSANRSRTGQFHRRSGTEDGFAPGPSPTGSGGAAGN